MRSRRSIFLLLPVFITTASIHLRAQQTGLSDARDPSVSNAWQAHISEAPLSMKTYPYSDANPVPALAINKKVAPFYPYFVFDGYTDKGVNKDWKVVKMENPYITVSVLPEVGGKVMGATEKASGKEFVYENHVMKFRAIGIRGPWTSGGIEHNFGLDLGHAPWAASPVDYVMKENPDGSVSCIVGGLDLASRSEWRVNIRLPKDKAYFETASMWYNPSPLHHAYLSWENAAFKATNDLAFFFPGDQHIGHDGMASPWPIDGKGRDLSLYKNNTFGGSKSYHVVGDYRNWYGGYWNDSEVGFGHWAPFADAPGKKLWIWSLARDGAIWEDLLTDKDGQYVEAQSGVKLNQTNERSGFHSPFTQHVFRPYYTEWKSEYWFPVVKTGGMVDASPYGTLNVTVQDSVRISVSPNMTIDDSIVVLSGGRRVYAGRIQARPMEVWRLTIAKPAGIGLDEAKRGLRVSVGNDKLLFSKDETAVHRPYVATPDDNSFTSAERSFRLGEEENAMRNYGLALTYYQQCLEQAPTHTEAMCRLAEYYYRSGDAEEGLKYARRALTYNAYDGSANYIYANLLMQLGRWTEAKEALSMAVMTMEYRSAAYAQLAGILLREKDYAGAVTEAEKALAFNKGNLQAYQIIIAASRRGRAVSGDGRGAGSTAGGRMADSVAKLLLDIDPLNHFAEFELGIDLKKTITNELPQESYLELAMTYVRWGLQEEAIKVLQQAPAHPMVYYWLAYLRGDRALLKTAEAMPARFVFPFRQEDVKVLQWAKGDSWKTKYYLGLVYWNNLQPGKARTCFKDCGDAPDMAAFYLARAALSQDSASALADIDRAIKIEPGEWRGYHMRSVYRTDLAQAAYKRFPGNPVIGMDYAKALIQAQRYAESLEVLDRMLVLPMEGAQEGHELYEGALLALALEKMEQGKFKDASAAIAKSRLWPERLGAGKPYDSDERLQDYMAAWCEEKLGRPQRAKVFYDSIAVYSAQPENWNAFRAGNEISMAALRRAGQSALADSLLKEWKLKQDSLRDWQLMPGASSDTRVGEGGKSGIYLKVKALMERAGQQGTALMERAGQQGTALMERAGRQGTASFGRSPRPATEVLPLLPVPKKVQLDGPAFVLGKAWKLVREGVDEKDIAVEEARALPGGGVIRLRLGDAAIPAQGYKMMVGKKEVVIAASAPQGLYYGVQTLKQLIKGRVLREGAIEEAPDLDIRMIYWDDAHHLEKMEALRRIVRQAAHYKINAIAIKLEGHFQYKCAPAIVEPRALSAVQLQELTDYAAKHYVEIVPYLDAPAHVSFILKHPEYAHLRLFPDNNYEFNVMHPGTDTLLRAMFGELIAATRGSRHVLLSTDEAYYVGKGGDEEAAAKALGSNSKLWAQFVGRLAEALHQQGRESIIWGEYPLKPEDIPMLPSHIINGVYDPATAANFKAHGMRQLIYTPTQGAEPVFPNYDPAFSQNEIKEDGSDRSSGRVPSMIKEIREAKAGGKSDFIGTIVAGWGDAGLHPETFWLGYTTGSAAGWNSAGEDLSERFYKSFYGRDMARAYRLLTTQAEYYDRSWDWGPSTWRSPILGNSYKIFDVPQLAKDQTFPALPLPPGAAGDEEDAPPEPPAAAGGDGSTLPPNVLGRGGNEPSRHAEWAGTKRLPEARRYLTENDELNRLLDQAGTDMAAAHKTLTDKTETHKAGPDQAYNLRVLKTVSSLCRQNLEMILALGRIDSLMRRADTTRALAEAEGILQRRDGMMRRLSAVWYEEWEELVPEANGRRFLLAVDNIKDHQPGRTIDLSYLIYRDLHYPLKTWMKEMQTRMKGARR